MHVMQTSGLDAALLERNFWYDFPPPPAFSCLYPPSLVFSRLLSSSPAISRLLTPSPRLRATRRYDLMLQGPWLAGLLKPQAKWSCDPVTRYVDGAIVRQLAPRPADLWDPSYPCPVPCLLTPRGVNGRSTPRVRRCAPRATTPTARRSGSSAARGRRRCASRRWASRLIARPAVRTRGCEHRATARRMGQGVTQ